MGNDIEDEGDAALTPFQIRVLQAIALGATDREAADQLAARYAQVRHAVRQAMAALHASNRSQAVYRAIACGLLPVKKEPRICA